MQVEAMSAVPSGAFQNGEAAFVKGGVRPCKSPQSTVDTVGRAVCVSVWGSRCVGALAEAAANGKSYPLRAAD
jgi:hypothetical protein